MRSKNRSDAHGQQANEGFVARRKMFRWSAAAFLSLWVFGACWVAGAFLKAPGVGERGAWQVISAGDADSLVAGASRIIRHRQQPILVIRDANDEITAVSAICTHLRCVLTWDLQEQVIRCPCHGATFNSRGRVLSGPAPRPLPRFDVEVRLGEILVHV